MNKNAYFTFSFITCKRKAEPCFSFFPLLSYVTLGLSDKIAINYVEVCGWNMTKWGKKISFPWNLEEYFAENINRSENILLFFFVLCKYIYFLYFNCMLLVLLDFTASWKVVLISLHCWLCFNVDITNQSGSESALDCDKLVMHKKTTEYPIPSSREANFYTIL